MKKLKSLSIFFPFLNDEKTVETAIDLAYSEGKKVADDLEVIAINGGKSKDNTFLEIKKQKKKHPDLIIVDRTNNQEGYAVVKYGLFRVSKDWVFYTDGDLQYDVKELVKLVDKQKKTGVDVVNGYKKSRNDNVLRKILGFLYQKISKFLFKLPIKDLDCDFRLIRRTCLKKIDLKSQDSSILLELIKKLEKTGAKFSEVEVFHYPRRYGQSNYKILDLLKEKVLGDFEVLNRLTKS
ncbi:glycosyltransferase family 2 protein [Candidatus Roizmanbacteria bacterium]|nr:glycosyltransferase family 2 protein [Candidatus Roizmanbacteria bacterium]